MFHDPIIGQWLIAASSVLNLIAVWTLYRNSDSLMDSLRMARELADDFIAMKYTSVKSVEDTACSTEMSQSKEAIPSA